MKDQERDSETNVLAIILQQTPFFFFGCFSPAPAPILTKNIKTFFTLNIIVQFQKKGYAQAIVTNF